MARDHGGLLVDDDEIAEALRYFQIAMRQAGLGELNARLVQGTRADPGPPRVQLSRYLEGLSTELRLETDESVRQIVAAFNRVAETESGRSIDGISVHLTDEDQQTFGVDVINLGTPNGLDAVISRLDDLRSALNESDL